MFNHKERVITKHNIKRYIRDGVLEIPDGIYEIADKAAYENSSIKKVIIPICVDVIGNKAFFGSSLEEIVFKERPCRVSITIKSFAFAKTNLKKVVLPVTATLEEGCFSDCSFLEQVLLGSNITEIPKYCFECTAISQILLHENIKKIGREAFSKTRISEISLPYNIDIIEEGVFSNNAYLKKVEACNLLYIPDSTFENCFILEKVMINYQHEFLNSALSIRSRAFYNCYKLDSLEIVGGYISNVENCAFYKCKELRRIDLSSTEKIGECAFAEANRLREVGQLKEVKEIAKYAFRDCYFLNNLVFGEKITTIGDSAFYKCKRLNKVELPKFLINLGSNVFSECTSLEIVLISSVALECLANHTFHRCIALKSVIFDEKCEIKSIQHDCFFECVSLTDIVLPKKIEFIGEDAFFNCRSLSELCFDASELIIKKNAFAYCERLKTCEIKGTIVCIEAAFRECHSLTTMTIPFPNKFGENFVTRCRNLQKIEFLQPDIF